MDQTPGTKSEAMSAGMMIQLKKPPASQYVSHDQRLTCLYGI
jgi:hypothetical protein